MNTTHTSGTNHVVSAHRSELLTCTKAVKSEWGKLEQAISDGKPYEPMFDQFKKLMGIRKEKFDYLLNEIKAEEDAAHEANVIDAKRRAEDAAREADMLERKRVNASQYGVSAPIPMEGMTAHALAERSTASH